MCHLIACVCVAGGAGVYGKHEVPGPYVGFCEEYRLQTEVRAKRSDCDKDFKTLAWNKT